MAWESLSVLVLRLFYNFPHVVFDTRVSHNMTVHLHSFIISSPNHQQLNPVHQNEFISAVTRILMHVDFTKLSLNNLYSAVDVLSKYLHLINSHVELRTFLGAVNKTMCYVTWFTLWVLEESCKKHIFYVTPINNTIIQLLY